MKPEQLADLVERMNGADTTSAERLMMGSILTDRVAQELLGMDPTTPIAERLDRARNALVENITSIYAQVEQESRGIIYAGNLQEETRQVSSIYETLGPYLKPILGSRAVPAHLTDEKHWTLYAQQHNAHGLAMRSKNPTMIEANRERLYKLRAQLVNEARTNPQSNTISAQALRQVLRGLYHKYPRTTQT